MRTLRRFGLLAAVAAGSAVLAGPALAARPSPDPPFTLDSAHFRVHYQSSAGGAITQTTAGDVAALAERAYAFEIADGFPAPLSDGNAGGGNNLIDLYVMPVAGALAYTDSDTTGSPADAYIVLDPNSGLTLDTIAHELFHAIQFGIWRPDPSTQPGEEWLLEATAEWMGYRATGYPSGVELGPPDMALDCVDPKYTNRCDLTDDYQNNGYSRWHFFEYLTERYGPSFVKDILNQGAAGAPTSFAAVTNALAAKGTTLADTYNAWTQADLIGAYAVSDLQGLAPVVYGSWRTGSAGGDLGTALVTVNHLSTRIVQFTRGDGDNTRACYEATLTLTVAMPSGTEQSRPVFWWNAEGNPPVPLTVSGGTASVQLPWDTCTYGATSGFLALPNASSNVDAADFKIKATLAVDKTKPATAANAPDPVFVPTTVVPVTLLPQAPTLELFGPEILRLTAKETVIRLIVQSSAQGLLRARLGSKSLGTVALRGGNNDVRLKLPKAMLVSLRRAAAKSGVLSLMPVSADGTATGTAVTRTIRVTPAKKQTTHRK